MLVRSLSPIVAFWSYLSLSLPNCNSHFIIFIFTYSSCQLRVAYRWLTGVFSSITQSDGQLCTASPCFITHYSRNVSAAGTFMTVCLAACGRQRGATINCAIGINKSVSCPLFSRTLETGTLGACELFAKQSFVPEF